MKKFLATLLAVVALTFAGASVASATDTCDVACEPPPVYDNPETSWGNGVGFDSANWAMYMPYNNGCGCVPLVAGNPKNTGVEANTVGYITFAEDPGNPGYVGITITLLKDTAAFAEPLKVHVLYSDTPPGSKLPSPGQFQVNLEKWSDFVYNPGIPEITIFNVPKAKYYAVHADVLTAD